MPSCTISHKGDISLNLETSRTINLVAKSISSSVVNLPIPKRMDVCAKSSSTPMARKTYEGSKLALVQALPELTATFLIAINKLSPSTYEKDKFKLPVAKDFKKKTKEKNKVVKKKSNIYNVNKKDLFGYF